MAESSKTYDCIIVGAGPGGLQAAIYLGRYNRKVLVLDRSGGRTGHAIYVENLLGHPLVSGHEIIETGIRQAKRFHVQFEKATVTKVLKKQHFEVIAEDGRRFTSSFVIISSGVRDNLPPIEHLHKFLGTSFFTCMDCDGYRTTGKQLVIIGNSIHTVRLAFAMKEMYTRDIALLLIFYEPPEDYKAELKNEGIILVKGRPKRILGDKEMKALELENGQRLDCEVIMSDFGFKLNDEFLSQLPLDRDMNGFKYLTNTHWESSVRGLYIVGPLNTGTDQIMVAAGQGATAAIDVKKRLLDI
jgi:thioredoxin reductase (NADPH)